MRAAALTAAAILAVSACGSSPEPRTATPTPPAAAPSPTAEPSRTPPPPEWAGDPDGKAACDAVQPYADGKITRPPAAALLAIATQAMRATNTRIAAAGVDLHAAARAADVPDATTAQRLELVGKAIRLGTACSNERYYPPQPWPAVS